MYDSIVIYKYIYIKSDLKSIYDFWGCYVDPHNLAGKTMDESDPPIQAAVCWMLLLVCCEVVVMFKTKKSVKSIQFI